MAAQAPQVNAPGPGGGGLIGGVVGNLLEPIAPGIGAAGPAAPSAVAKAGASGILGSLNLGGWLLRVGEILAGLILLGIGLNSMLKGRPLAAVTSVAGVAGKLVP